MHGCPPSAIVLYHYLPPDDVVSAVLFGDLCAGMAAHGWNVTAIPCIWGCRDENARYSESEIWRNVVIRRIRRPRIRQSSASGRFLNALWMICTWSLLALQPGSYPDVLLIGTDPPLSIFVALFWKLFRPRTKIVHWCHDLFPEAAVSDGLLPAKGLFNRVLRAALRPAYAACSVIVDLGPCMRRMLAQYPSNARRETISPWALDEPEQVMPTSGPERARVFGDARLALMYSGSFGRAHSGGTILDLLEILEPHGVRMAFCIRGNRTEELQQSVAERQLDVRFPGFVRAEELASRSAAADVHVVSLNREWTGTVVPSKFFGALATGRPVLFCGSPDSSLARWIEEFDLGWVLHDGNTRSIADQLLAYAASPAQQEEMRKRCFHTYHAHFSRRMQMKKWDNILRSLLSRGPSIEQLGLFEETPADIEEGALVRNTPSCQG